MVNTKSSVVLPCDCCGHSQWQYTFRENGVDLGRCANCGLYYIAQMPSQETRITEMEKGGFTGNQCSLDATKHKDTEIRREKLFQHFVELAQKLAPPGKWLDIGCGAGTLISLAQEQNIEIEGIDLTPSRRELTHELTGATIYGRPIEELDIASETFAVVTLSNVFSHLISPSSTFTRIHHVLKQGGIMLLYTSEIGPGVAKHHSVSWCLGDHLYFLGDHTIERYADNLGFELVQRKKQWDPALVYTRNTFLTKGRSALRNFIKCVCVYTPGVMSLLQCYMLKIRHKNNPHYRSTLLLRKVSKK